MKIKDFGFIAITALCTLLFYASHTLFISLAEGSTKTAVNAQEIVATCLIREAANHGPGGMHAVMNVIQNRAENDPSKFVPIVLEWKQFSSFNKVNQGKQSLDNLIKMSKGDFMWGVAIVITKEAYKKRLRDITFGADHFASAPTYWSEGMVITIRIGNFTFYRSRKR